MESNKHTFHPFRYEPHEGPRDKWYRLTLTRAAARQPLFETPSSIPNSGTCTTHSVTACGRAVCHTPTQTAGQNPVQKTQKRD